MRKWKVQSMRVKVRMAKNVARKNWGECRGGEVGLEGGWDGHCAVVRGVRRRLKELRGRENVE